MIKHEGITCANINTILIFHLLVLFTSLARWYPYISSTVQLNNETMQYKMNITD